jgi:hypothetical protein
VIRCRLTAATIVVCSLAHEAAARESLIEARPSPRWVRQRTDGTEQRADIHTCTEVTPSAVGALRVDGVPVDSMGSQAAKSAVLMLLTLDSVRYRTPPKGTPVSKLMIALFVTAGLGFAGTGIAQTYATKSPAPTMSKEGYATAKSSADAQYKLDKEACAALGGNTKDICMAEATGKDNAAKADAQAAYEGTPKAREAARVAHAEATHQVAVEKCDDLAGNAKDVCVKEANAGLVKGKANAKVDRVAADTNNDAAVKQADARKDATADKRDADYKVAVEKCDTLAGPTKDACVDSAKAQYGKS